MDLINATLNAKSLKDFIYGDGLIYVLYELDLTAAQNAIKKAKNARDKKSQLWSAVNHLESAEQKIWSLLNSDLRRSFRSFDEDNLIKRRRYILCLMAMIYKVIGERKLMNSMIEKANFDLEYHFNFTREKRDLHKVLFAFTVLINPLNYYDLIKETWSNGENLMELNEMHEFEHNLKKVRIR